MFPGQTQAVHSSSRRFATIGSNHQRLNVSKWKRYPCCLTITLVFTLRCLFLHSSHQYTYLLFWWFCCGSSGVWRPRAQARVKFPEHGRDEGMILMTLAIILAHLDFRYVRAWIIAFKCIHLCINPRTQGLIHKYQIFSYLLHSWPAAEWLWSSRMLVLYLRI